MSEQSRRGVDISAGVYYREEGDRAEIPADFVRDLPTNHPEEKQRPMPVMGAGESTSEVIHTNRGEKRSLLSSSQHSCRIEPGTGPREPACSTMTAHSGARASQEGDSELAERFLTERTDAETLINALDTLLQEYDPSIRFVTTELIDGILESGSKAAQVEILCLLYDSLNRRQLVDALFEFAASHPYVVSPEAYISMFSLIGGAPKERIVTAVGELVAEKIDSREQIVHSLRSHTYRYPASLDRATIRAVVNVDPDLIVDDLEGWQLYQMLSSEDPIVRTTAIRHVEASFSFPERDLVSKLRECLSNEDARVRGAALDRLDCLYDDYRYTSKLPDLSTDLRPLLSDPNQEVRESATRFILHHGEVQTENAESLVDNANTWLTGDAIDLRKLGVDTLREVVQAHQKEALAALEPLHRVALEPNEEDEIQLTVKVILSTLRDELTDRQLTLDYPYQLTGIEFAVWKARAVSALVNVKRGTEI